MPALISIPAQCVDLLRVTPQSLCITLPGAVDVCVQLPDAGFPDPIEVVKQLFAQLNSALTPLQPFFNVLDLVITLVQCVQAIPGGLTEFPPFKTLLEDCIPVLPGKLAQVLALVPQLSIPITIVGFIDAVIVILDGFILFLNRTVTTLNRIVAAETRAVTLGSTALQAIVDCSRENVEVEMENFNEGLGALSLIFSLIDVFIGLAAIPGVPVPLPTLTNVGLDPTAALEPVEEFLKIMKNIRAAIPL